MTATHHPFSEALRCEIEKRLLTREAAAKKIGVSRFQLLNWMNGANPRPLSRERIARFMNISRKELDQLIAASIKTET